MFHAPPPADSLSVDELARIMRWYVEMGVDIVVDGEAHDRFADCAAELARRAAAARPSPPEPLQSVAPVAGAGRAPIAPQQLRQAPPTAAALTQEAFTQSARESALAARTLDELRAALEAFEGCGLKRSASRLVFADGNPHAKIMLIGEAPGEDEDRQGVPFIGRAGKLLDRMLAAIGLDRAQVYIANVAPWRPPGNRTPTPQETAVCLPFIRRQIALVNPDVIVCLGAASMQSLLGVKEGVLRSRGKWFDFKIDRDDGVRHIKALATLHPAYLLRTPRAKREAWLDMRILKKALNASA